ncbi:hypothetical protein PR048_017310 [Dryococelus australis]|uniref:Uncharacterized protein n=1 Tax=Dryococelus australis TaxID=614101 RepID=A0ABQ9H968_9NEOP|nr:hypothetical protein PR048_017310 [Dryococelus australis]
MPECSNSVVILDLELPAINAGGPDDSQVCDFDDALLSMVIPASKGINRDVSQMDILPEVENNIQKIPVQNRQTCNSNNTVTVMANDEPPFPESSADEMQIAIPKMFPDGLLRTSVVAVLKQASYWLMYRRVDYK